MDWNLTVVDDHSLFLTHGIINRFVDNTKNAAHLEIDPDWGVLGGLKNLGVRFSELRFGRGEYLYVMDNDGYYTEWWDGKLLDALIMYGDKVKLAGPYRHPYHQPNEIRGEIAITDAVQGIGHLMTWETWDKYGPYDANAKGTNQSEDYAFCRRIVDDGYLVGSIQPDVVYNCGLTDTQGKPCVGIETMAERVEGVYYE